MIDATGDPDAAAMTTRALARVGLGVEASPHRAQRASPGAATARVVRGSSRYRPPPRRRPARAFAGVACDSPRTASLRPSTALACSPPRVEGSEHHVAGLLMVRGSLPVGNATGEVPESGRHANPPDQRLCGPASPCRAGCNRYRLDRTPPANTTGRAPAKPSSCVQWAGLSTAWIHSRSRIPAATVLVY